MLAILVKSKHFSQTLPLIVAQFSRVTNQHFSTSLVHTNLSQPSKLGFHGTCPNNYTNRNSGPDYLHHGSLGLPGTFANSVLSPAAIKLDQSVRRKMEGQLQSPPG